MRNTTIKPRGKFFNPPPAPKEEEYPKTIHDDSITYRVKSATNGKFEKRVAKYFGILPEDTQK